jgi:hypothetical protein
MSYVCYNLVFTPLSTPFSYVSYLDRIKLTLLRQTPGPEAAVLACDLTVRMTAKCMQAELQV